MSLEGCYISVFWKGISSTMWFRGGDLFFYTREQRPRKVKKLVQNHTGNRGQAGQRSPFSDLRFLNYSQSGHSLPISPTAMRIQHAFSSTRDQGLLALSSHNLRCAVSAARFESSPCDFWKAGRLTLWALLSPVTRNPRCLFFALGLVLSDIRV